MSWVAVATVDYDCRDGSKSSRTINLLQRCVSEGSGLPYLKSTDDLWLQMRRREVPDWRKQDESPGSPGVQVSAWVRASALVFCFSDGWNQAACGFILTDLVDGERTHRLDLYGPQVGILWLICKPCLFWERAKNHIETKRRDIRWLMLRGGHQIGFSATLYIIKEIIAWIYGVGWNSDMM